MMLGAGPLPGWVPVLPGPGSALPEALALARQLTTVVPVPGSGRTVQRWQWLAEVAAVDLTTARVLEAHLDAVAILDEARRAAVPEVPATPPQSTWGVFAAEAPGQRLTATATGTGWRLDGRKPWCSLADRLSHALVTAHTDQGRRLFAVELSGGGVRVQPGGWQARGLRDVPSGPVEFVAVPAVPVGADGWYLQRAGFAHGGLGVAACWYGGAVGLARTLWEAAGRRETDQLARWHLGEVDLDLHRAATSLRAAATAVDAGEVAGPDGVVTALRVRSVVASAAEQVLQRVGHALGPAPLSLDAAHAARVADLTLYLRQHHAERDGAALGGALLAAGRLPW